MTVAAPGGLVTLADARYAWSVSTGRIVDTWTGLACSRTWTRGAGLPRVRLSEGRRALLGALLAPLLPARWRAHVITLTPADATSLWAVEAAGGPNTADIPLSLLILRAPGRPGRALGGIPLAGVLKL